MFTLIEARFAAATVADLEEVHARLSRLIGELDDDLTAAAWHTLMAITELVFVEAQLRLEHVDAELRRIIDRPT